MPDTERKTIAEWQAEGVLWVEDGNHGENRPRKHEFCEEGMAFIRVADMRNGSVIFDDAEKIDEVAQARVRKGVGRPEDILISHKGTVGRVARAPRDAPPFVCSPQTTFWRVLDHDRLDRDYLFALMRSYKFQAEFAVRAGETDMAGYVSLTSQRDLELELPRIETQRAIGRIVGAFDDKIELNRRMSATLEEMARALYRSWFVDFDPVHARAAGQPPAHMAPTTAALFPDSFGPDGLPKGWQRKRLGDLLTLNYGKALKKSSREPGPYHVYGSGGTNTTHARALVSEPTIIVGRKGTVGSVMWEPNGCWPIDTTFYVTSNLSMSFILRTLEALPLVDMNTDAAVPGLNRENAYRLEVPLPQENVLSAFDEMAAKWQAKIDHAATVNKILAALRDALLPRLMSGELRILEAEKMGWMPRSPNGIAMCQACDVNAQDRTGDGIHGRSYHHRH